MIGLLPIGRIFAAVAVLYAVVACGILWSIIDTKPSLSDAIAIAFSGATILNLVLLILLTSGWRLLWRMFPSLNDILFPDLNGSWEMIIHWEFNGEHGISRAQAQIKQSFVKIGMDVDAADSESETLMAMPKKDFSTGRPALYYMFETTPKQKGRRESVVPYKGAAILKLTITGTNQLGGNYFTNIGSKGHFELTKEGVKS